MPVYKTNVEDLQKIKDLQQYSFLYDNAKYNHGAHWTITLSPRSRDMLAQKLGIDLYLDHPADPDHANDHVVDGLAYKIEADDLRKIKDDVTQYAFLHDNAHPHGSHYSIVLHPRTRDLLAQKLGIHLAPAHKGPDPQ